MTDPMYCPCCHEPMQWTRVLDEYSDHTLIDAFWECEPCHVRLTIDQANALRFPHAAGTLIQEEEDWDHWLLWESNGNDLLDDVPFPATDNMALRNDDDA